MISITPQAQEKLIAYLKENKLDLKIRVYLPECDCSGSGGQVSLTLDQPAPEDIVVKAGDLELFISPELHDTLGKVYIDFKDMGYDSGFVVTSDKPLPSDSEGGCAGCSSCC